MTTTVLRVSVNIAGAPIHVSTDAARLAQAVGNVLNNASKFTPRGGWGQEDDRRPSAVAGFDMHLERPVDHDALVKLIDELPSAGARPRL